MTTVREKGLVSVIIPAYNAERFLAEAVDSVLAQSYTQWELLLIDDGSTDSSTKIARQYADSEPDRITYLEHLGHRNAGVCASRNLGVRHSRGEYVALLDADDIWLPEKLQQQVELMQRYPDAGLIYGRSIYFEDGRSGEWVPELAAGGKLYSAPTLMKLNYPLGKTGAPCPSGFLMRYELLDEIDGFEESFDQNAPVYEDQAFLAKVYLHTAVFVDKRCWDRYRCHDASCSSRTQQDGREYRSREFYLGWLERYLREKGIEDEEIWSAVQSLSWPYRHPVLAGARRVLRGAARRAMGTTSKRS